MPGFYQPGEYDLSGTIVGVVEKSKILDGRTIRPGDAVIGLASSGLHTNGYSLARKILFDQMKWKPRTYVPELRNTIGNELLKVHVSYGPLVLSLLKRFNPQPAGLVRAGLPRRSQTSTAATKLRSGTVVRIPSPPLEERARERRPLVSKFPSQNASPEVGPGRLNLRPAIGGLAHITGGGFIDNIPRVLPKNCDVIIRKSSWPLPPIFRLLQDQGRVPEVELYQVFNMGIGMTAIVRSNRTNEILQFIRAQKQRAWLIGEVRQGRGLVRME